MNGLAGLLGVDHLGIAVTSIPEALPLFCDVLGARFILGGDDPVLGIRTVQLALPPGVKLELMQPLRDDSYLHGYLAARGPGFHHLTVFVRDLPTALAALDAKGFEVVDTELSSPRWRVTYVRPRSGFGTLLQIAETSVDWHEPIAGVTLEAVLAGEVVWDDERPTLRSALEDPAWR